MAVPRNRHSVSRRNKKRSHSARDPKKFIACKNCGVKKLSHTACPDCGQYAGKSFFAESAAE